MYKYLVLFTILLLSSSTQAQDVRVEAGGPVKEDRSLKENVVNIKSFQNVNVFISQSDTSNINVEVGHVDLFKKVNTIVNGDTLVISVDEIYFTNKLYEHPINVYVNLKNINSITANANSRVVVSTPIKSDLFNIKTTTEARVEFQKEVEATNLKLISTLQSHVVANQPFKVNMATLTVGTKATISMNLITETSLECYVTNESTVNLRGSANNVLVTCQDKSIVRMRDFTCEYANAFATYEGSITIIPNNTLTATATYKGTVITSKAVKNLIKSESTQGKVRF